jgi:hypothetical protein
MIGNEISSLSMHGIGYLLPLLFPFIFIRILKPGWLNFGWTPLFHSLDLDSIWTNQPINGRVALTESQAPSIRHPSQPRNGTRGNQRNRNIIGLMALTGNVEGQSEQHHPCQNTLPVIPLRAEPPPPPIVDGVVRSPSWVMGFLFLVPKTDPNVPRLSSTSSALPGSLASPNLQTPPWARPSRRRR